MKIEHYEEYQENTHIRRILFLPQMQQNKDQTTM